MLVSDFDFPLPEELIAQQAAPRGASRLLHLGDEMRHSSIAQLPELLEVGDLLVVNDTRVLPARLYGNTATGAKVEILLVRKIADCEWEVLAKPGRKARPGARLRFERAGDAVEAEVVGEVASGQYRLLFAAPIEPHLEALGHVPLPPYIRRPDEAGDHDRYQTVYARRPGAIAAPTAGLHFSESLLDAVRDRGIELTTVTLHVGIGTFKPVRAKLVSEHRMDEEEYEVPAAAADAVRRTRERGGRVVAVGTTVVRTLESVARENAGDVVPQRAATDLFIYPGFEFRVVDRLLTNFHLPRSSLLMLVSAFAGRERILEAYAEAIRERYRFYSYGDAMLIDPAPSS